MWEGTKGISGEHLYAHFYEEGHEGIENRTVKIIDKTNVNAGFYRCLLK